MSSILSKSILDLNSIAMGKKPADLVIKNCSLVNVYTNEITPQTEIGIIENRIGFVGSDASHMIGKKTKLVDLAGKFVTPGFADPHIHIDQFVLPSEFVKKSLLHGVTSIFSDPIDIVSVTGFGGFCQFLKYSRNLPMRIFHVVPGGLPVDPEFSHGKFLTLSQIKSCIKNPNVVGLGEVFSWTKVTNRDPKTMETIMKMLDYDCVINGHTAGASGNKLNAYVSSGILSCHEPINFEQVLERLRLGMWIMVREGSIRRDLKEILSEAQKSKIPTNRIMFCSDGVDPLDLEKFGHIDHCVRETIKLGYNPVEVFAMASRNCFDYYNKGKDLGGIAPGKIADFLVLNDLKNIKPEKVFFDGKLVVDNFKIISKISSKPSPRWIQKTVNLQKFSERDFLIKSTKPSANVNLILMRSEIITQISQEELIPKNQNVAPSYDKDIWKVAAFDRIFGSKKHAIGFLKNFGAEIGAFASTWSFHENDLIVIGSNEKDMAFAANELKKFQGGMIVVKDQKVICVMPLKLAGIISVKSFEKVSKEFTELISILVDLGCKFKKPHLIPLFLPFLALPEIRILHSGIIDVKKRISISPLN